jgi:hypothetical protein
MNSPRVRYVPLRLSWQKPAGAGSHTKFVILPSMQRIDTVWSPDFTYLGPKTYSPAKTSRTTHPRAAAVVFLNLTSSHEGEHERRIEATVFA